MAVEVFVTLTYSNTPEKDTYYKKCPNFAEAYHWADGKLPANCGCESEFNHTYDDVLEHAYACVREGNPVIITTQNHSGNTEVTFKLVD